MQTIDRIPVGEAINVEVIEQAVNEMEALRDDTQEALENISQYLPEAFEAVRDETLAARDIAVPAAASAEADADRAEIAADNAQSSSRTVSLWADLLAVSGTHDREGAEVLDSDTAAHNAASGTGYDGASVPNAGRYSWNSSWARWVRVGATGLSGKLDKSTVNPDGGTYYYKGNRMALTIRDLAGRVMGGFTQSGEFLAKLGVIAGANLTVTQDASGRMVVAFGATPGVLPVGDAGNISGDGSRRYVNGVEVVGGLSAISRFPWFVGKDGTVYVHKLTVANLTADNDVTLLREVATYGDSLTDGAGGGGQTLASGIQSAIGVTTYKRAIGGQWAGNISHRQGGLVADVTISGNQIVSGVNNITHFNGDALSTLAVAAGWPGLPLTTTAGDGATRTLNVRIANIAGVLTCSKPGGVETYTFTPDGGQTLPVRCPARTAMVLTDNDASAFGSAKDMRRVNVLWYGRNDDWTTPTGIMAALEASVQRLIDSGNSRFLILTVINGNYSSEFTGTSRYGQLGDINRAIAKRWPQKTFDARRWLIEEALGVLGITPTAQDLIDIGNDTVPASLRSDNIHLTGAAYTALGVRCAAELTARGYI